MNDTTNDTTTDRVPHTVYRMFYVPVGGPNYSTDITPNDDAFDTIEEAAHEWARRRNDWTGRFPCWGDGAHIGEEAGAGSTAVIGVLFLQDDDDEWSLPCDTVEGYSVRELEEHIGESSNYYDEDDEDDDLDEDDDDPSYRGCDCCDIPVRDGETPCDHHPDIRAVFSNVGRLANIHRDAVWHYCPSCADHFLTDEGRHQYRVQA